MKSKFFDHFGMKVLSLVIAVLVWIVVANVDDYMTTKQITGIEIEFINGDVITKRNKVYEVTEGSTIDIVVKGPRKTVQGLSNLDFKAVADLSKMSVTNAVMVDVRPVDSAKAKELTISYADNTVMVAVENKIERQFPITVRSKGDVLDGFAVRSKTATPNLISIKGAESAVNLIEEVVVDVEVGGSNHNITAQKSPVFIDKSGQIIDPSKFEYDVKNVDIAVDILPTKELKIKLNTVGETKENYAISSIDYQPTSILVVGDAADLSKVDELVIEAVDVTGCSEDLEMAINILDYLPSGITLVDENSEIMVKVIIEELKEKTITLTKDDINLVGKNEEFAYHFKNAENYEIRVNGLKSDLDELKLTNLIPSIDVTGLMPGIYTMEVSLRDIHGITVVEGLTVELEIVQK